MSEATVMLKSGAKVTVKYMITQISGQFKVSLFYMGKEFTHKASNRNEAIKFAQAKLINSR